MRGMTEQFFAMRNFAVLAALAILPATAGPGSAQSYPSRTVKIVVPYAAGGTSGSDRVVEWRLCNSYQKNALSKTF
jgi:tripartite-type tricarboxylate transporter receptor subunit TctC